MTRFALSIVLLALAALAHGEGPAPTFPAPAFKENEERMGQPSRIVAPEYPREALREKRAGVVEVSGHVSPLGVLEGAKVAAVPPADDAFAAAVREVLEYWRFYVPTDSACQPDAGTVTNRVEFSADDGTPHIAVLRLASPKVEPRAQFKPLRRVDPGYPERAIREGVQANVYVRIEVDAEGNVSAASAKAYSTRVSNALLSMEGEARRALRAWRFPPPDDGKPWVGCYTITFSLRD